MRLKEVSRQWEYDKAHTKQIKLKLNLVTDKDVLDKLDRTDNVQGYIKSLVRSDIESERSMDKMKSEWTIIAYKGSKRSELRLDEYGYLVYKNGRHYNDETYSDESYSLINDMLIRDGWRIEE